MRHPLVTQLRFARSEFRRGLEGVSEAEARMRFLPMNCISWNVGHLSWQEQRYWLTLAHADTPYPELNERFAFGAPASTPDLDEMWRCWNEVSVRADRWLDTATTEMLAGEVVVPGRQDTRTLGSLLLRLTYHYWYHTGENAAIRQQLGHTGLPDFVGNLDTEAPYQPESAP